MGEIFAQAVEVSEGNSWNWWLKRFEGDHVKINGMGMATMASAEGGAQIRITLSVIMCVALQLHHFRLKHIFCYRFVLTGQQIERQEINRQ